MPLDAGHAFRSPESLRAFWDGTAWSPDRTPAQPQEDVQEILEGRAAVLPRIMGPRASWWTYVRSLDLVEMFTAEVKHALRPDYTKEDLLSQQLREDVGLCPLWAPNVTTVDEQDRAWQCHRMSDYSPSPWRCLGELGGWWSRELNLPRVLTMSDLQRKLDDAKAAERRWTSWGVSAYYVQKLESKCKCKNSCETILEGAVARRIPVKLLEDLCRLRRLMLSPR